MIGPPLDRTASVWRSVLDPADPDQMRKLETQVYASVRCALVPISKLDQQVAFANEATHVLWIGKWIVLQFGDQVRTGRRDPLPTDGEVLPESYVVRGRSRYSMGTQQQTYYADERT